MPSPSGCPARPNDAPTPPSGSRGVPSSSRSFGSGSGVRTGMCPVYRAAPAIGTPERRAQDPTVNRQALRSRYTSEGRASARAPCLAGGTLAACVRPAARGATCGAGVRFTRSEDSSSCTASLAPRSRPPRSRYSPSAARTARRAPLRRSRSTTVRRPPAPQAAPTASSRYTIDGRPVLLHPQRHGTHRAGQSPPTSTSRRRASPARFVIPLDGADADVVRRRRRARRPTPRSSRRSRRIRAPTT